MTTIRQEVFWDREQSLRLVETPIARSSDPESSHRAAAEITASGRRQQQITMVINMVRKFPGMTSMELAGMTGEDRYVIARRLPEAATAGAVCKGQQRSCAVTSKLALTWWPVDPGMKAAA
jgi:hypothetical protein